MKAIFLLMSLAVSMKVFGAEVDCVSIFGSDAKCEQVACDEKQKSFLGKWSGEFQSYSQEFSTAEVPVYRSFQNSVVYSDSDCLKNTTTGDTIIVGHRTDFYPAFRNLPAKTESGLLVTGSRVDGTPFLMTVDNAGTNEYTLVYKNAIAVLAVWKLTIPAQGNNPEMRFTTIDGRDFTSTTTNKRNVVVTMSIGPVETPIWEGVVSQGSHTLQK